MRKNIFYGVAGEGLGHASRTLAIIENLCQKYNIFVFTYGESYELFSKVQSENPEIKFSLFFLKNGIKFSRKNNKIKIFSTFLNVLKHKINVNNEDYCNISSLVKKIKPDLFITDFEPTVSKMARFFKVPLISIDNQHKFAIFSNRNLPFSLRIFGNTIGFLTEIYIGKIDQCIVSTFYYQFGQTIKTNVLKTNVFLRKEFFSYLKQNNGYYVLYYKPSISKYLIEKLIKATNKKIIVYGCPESNRIKASNLIYKEINYKSFCEDLAGCDAVFCSSGNQLLGECSFFEKPVFTIPEPNQYEQNVNAYYLKKMNLGESFTHNNYNENNIKDFLNNFVPKYKNDQISENGVDQVCNFIINFLEKNNE